MAGLVPVLSADAVMGVPPEDVVPASAVVLVPLPDVAPVAIPDTIGMNGTAKPANVGAGAALLPGGTVPLNVVATVPEGGTPPLLL